MTAPARVHAPALCADHTLVGDTPIFRQLLADVRRIAPNPHAVLIVGERGTGKELVARALHDWSGRPGPFVPFNVATINRDMAESDLFGHVRGAFTGAIDDRAGYLAEADWGTVFLDEIGALPFHVQPKLLRAIDLKEFRPVGGRADRHSNFRLVAATNEDLFKLAQAERFRDDLHDRLRALTVRVPALRERKADIPLLVRHYLQYEGIVDDAHRELTPSVVGALSAYHWPGNIRELRHLVNWLALFAASWPLAVADIERALAQYSAPEEQPTLSETMARVNTDREVERWYLAGVLRDTAGDVNQAAKALDVHRATVYRKMHAFHLNKYGLADMSRLVDGPAHRELKVARISQTSHDACDKCDNRATDDYLENGQV